MIGDTALMVAISGGHREVVELLLENGADIEKTTKDKITPLILAVVKGRIDIIKLLLANGVNINKAAANGDTPLMIAIDKDVFLLLLENGAKWADIRGSRT